RAGAGRAAPSSRGHRKWTTAASWSCLHLPSRTTTIIHGACRASIGPRTDRGVWRSTEPPSAAARFCEHCVSVATLRETDRLRALVETGIAINSELSLDGVLERIVEAAARVTGAQYAALGVIDPSSSGLERFVTYGITADVHTQIGDPPHGRGILGV